MEVFLLVAKEVAVAMEALEAVAMLGGGRNCGCPRPVMSGGRSPPVAKELVAVDTVDRDVAAVVMSRPAPRGLVICDWPVLCSTGAFIRAVAMEPEGRAMLPEKK